MYDVHDNEINSYIVNLKKHEIIISTTNSHNNDVDIIFKNVLTHKFETVMENSIIFDIEKLNGIEMIRQNDILLEETKEFDWPICYNQIEDLAEKLKYDNYYYYIISSTYGLSGWVVAKEMEIR